MIITTDKVMRPRDPDDFYPTPLGLCIQALDVLPPDFCPQTIIDPGAGGGAWGIAARRKWVNTALTGVDIRQLTAPACYDGWLRADFRLLNMPLSFDAVIGNPPYKYAEAFVRGGLDMLRPGGWMVFLLRLAFLEGQDRGGHLWREFPPSRVMICSTRPSFTGDNKTDATAYAVYYWQRGVRDHTDLGWLK